MPLICLCCSAKAQWQMRHKRLAGCVKDLHGVPVAGAQLLLINSNAGTLTNAKGLFSLVYPYCTDTLMIACAGFQSRKIKVRSGENYLLIYLEKKD